MAQNTNLNVSPYYDDYNPDKNFYRVLFRPGYSVQSRELTSLQSILQDQIGRYGSFQFKQGDLVVPGEIGLNTRFNYVKLSSVSEVAVNIDDEIVFKKYDIAELKGQTLAGVTSGVQAIVIDTFYESEENSDTLFVSYINSGDSNNEETFRQGELLEVLGGINTPTLTVGTDGAVLPNFIQIENIDTGEVTSEFSPALGFASAINVQEGIYFINGFFVKNKNQIVIIDSYNNKASAKVAFDVIESIVTPEQDPSLFDNSRGFSNFSSPGSHRLKIELVAKKYNYNESVPKSSIELVSIKNGEVEKKLKSRNYNLIEDTLARRTYDESGDYVVTDFDFEVREFYQKDSNNGLYALNSSTGKVNGVDKNDAEEKLVATVGPGKAYVKGYEIVNKDTKYLIFEKSKDTITRNNVSIKSSGYSSFYITNVYGSVPVNAEGVELQSYPTVFLFNSLGDGSIGLNGTSDSFLNTKSSRGKLLTAGTVDIEGNTLDNLRPSDIGIKTIWIEKSVDYLPSYNESFLPEVGDFIWVIRSYTQTDGSNAPRTAQVEFAKIISTSLSTNQKVNPGSSIRYAEITIAGRRDIVDGLFKDFDIEDNSSRRRVFLSKSSAFTVNDLPVSDELGNPIIPPLTRSNYYWGSIVDYTNTISPLIGITKPLNFTKLEYGEGFNSLKDRVASKGISSSGEEIYNATYSLSQFNPIFFTKVVLDKIITSGFSVGKYVTGITSGAYGVIEGNTSGYYSSIDTLHVKMQQGSFIEGESLIDEDGNIVRIAKSNTISHFIVHRQGSNYDDSSVMRLDGVLYDKSKISVNRVDNGTIISNITILDDIVRQTEYINPPTIEITQGNGAVVSAVLYKNTIVTYTSADVKSFYCEYGFGTQGSNIFTADVATNSSKYSDFVSVTSSTFSGTKGFNYLSVNSLSVDLSKILKQGDIIQYIDDSGSINRSIVFYATSSNGNIKSRIYLTSVLKRDVISSEVSKISSKLENPNASLLFKTGSSAVSSIAKDITDSKISYFFRRDFISSGSSSGGSLTFAAQLTFGTQRFVEFTKENFIMTVLYPGSGESLNFSAGDIVEIKKEFVNITSSTDDSSGLVAGTATITFPSGYFGQNMTEYPKVKLTATLEVSKAKPKLKTSIKNKRIVVTPSNDKVITIRGQDYDSGDIGVFSFSDVYKLRYVYEGTSTSAPKVDSNGNLIEGKDITNSFVFDDGQRETFYDVSRIILKPGEQSPTGRLVIGFDYFEHSQGEFCTVDSYTHESGVSISEIPKYNSISGIISLRDVIDFRPKVDSTVITSGFQNRTYLSVKDYISFTKEGGVPSVSIASDFNLEYSLKFNEESNLSRIDALFLNKSGEFIIKKGNPSKNPSRPELIEDSILLYYIYLPAALENIFDIKLVPSENKRYTMKDIATIEKRVERLEYYTALSILEQQTLNMQIKDRFGFDKFKSGFLADNFETHKIGNIFSSEYACAIDSRQSVLRPEVYEDNIKIIESNFRDDQRFISGYVNNNDVITLPYSPVNLLGNNSATKIINPNPFVVLQYVGDIKISPNIDKWFTKDIVPLVTNNSSNLFDVFFAKKDDPDVAFSSIYNLYAISWTGVNSVFNDVNPVSNSNIDQSQSTSADALVSSSSNISPSNNNVAKGIDTKNINNFSIVSSLHYFVRSIPVKFVVTRMKPKTRIYPFIDDRDISRWTISDNNFTGIASSSLSSFGAPIITDEYGNASGIILIPSGNAPLQGSSWTGNILDVQYDETSEKIYLTSGNKTIKFTSSETNEPKELVESYSDINFYSSGINPENPPSIISTQPSYFKSNEGIQFVESNTDNKIRPNPLAQTFKIENYEGGLYLTDIDLYFNKKSSNIPIKVYLTDVNIAKPGKNIIPGSEVVLLPKTYIRIFLTGNITIKLGDILRGVTSGCQGPLEKILDKNGNEVSLINNINYNLTNDQVYTFIISNHNGKEFIQDEVISSREIERFNAQNNSNIIVRICKDSGKVKSFVIENTGSNYEGAIITVESPQLPGESLASAFPFISGGIIYDVSVSLSGSGYTDAPSVVVRGIGQGSSGAVIRSVLDIDTPAVRMGVAIDDGTNIDSSTPTKFKFDYPIYLLNDTEYTIQIETDSTEYALWSSRLGEIEVISGINVSSQPLLGSLYRSQNTDTWVEDIFEDLKFTLNRAKFDISKSANLVLVNEPLQMRKLSSNPFETNSSSNTNATSNLFKANNSIVKVYHKNHGLEGSGKSRVFFRKVNTFSGISGNAVSNSLFRVSSVGIDSYTIKSPSLAGDSARGGGNKVLAPYNVKYEKIYLDGSIIEPNYTQINSQIKTTNIVPIDSSSSNYVSYSVSDFEPTFIGQEQYFENQKIVSSPINEILNNTGKSLIYKLSLSSNKDYLSPVIDLNNFTVKTSTSRVENSTGYEDRYAKRYQLLKFWSVYTFVISGINTSQTPIANNQTIRGRISSAEGRIISVDGSKVTVRMENDGLFEANEGIIFSDPSNESFNTNLLIRIDSGFEISEIIPNFSINDRVTAFNPVSNVVYNNIIDGRVIVWDDKSQTLTLQVEKKPINDNFTDPTLANGIYARISVRANQVDDIFRINDSVTFDRALPGTQAYLKVKSSEFTRGVDYRNDIEILSTSSVTKYLTKDISLNVPANSLDVRLTANIQNISNVIVMYKVLESNSQESFSNTKWNYMISNNDELNIKKSDTILGIFETREDYNELKYYINDLPDFSKYAIKIILKTDDPVYSPKIQDFRVVASY